MIVACPLVVSEDELLALGEKLKFVRESKNLMPFVVAEDLLISTKQLSGLECYSLQCFFSTRHYIQILRKYCRYLDVHFPEDVIVDGAFLAGTSLASETLIKDPMIKHCAHFLFSTKAYSWVLFVAFLVLIMALYLIDVFTVFFL